MLSHLLIYLQAGIANNLFCIENVPAFNDYYYIFILVLFHPSFLGSRAAFLKMRYYSRG